MEAVDEGSLVVGKCNTPAKFLNSIRPRTFVRMVQKIIENNSRESMNAIAKEIQVSRHAVERIAHEELRDISYVKRKG